MNLSTHDAPQACEDNGYDVASYMPLGVDGYFAQPVPSQWQQTGIYKLPLMSPSRGKIILRKDFADARSPRPNVFMPIWGAPSRGRIVANVGGQAQTPMNSFDAGQVNVNAFIANSDLSSTVAASFIAQKSARYTGPNLAQTGGD